MTDPRWPAEFIAPDYVGSGVNSVLPIIAQALGVDDITQPQHPAWSLGPSQRICVVVVDGLGWHNLTERNGHAPYMRSLLSHGQMLTTVFPSTTAAALTAFGTGATPGQTAMVGYTQRIGDRIANMVSWADAPPPQEHQVMPRLLESIQAAGVAVHSVGPTKFARSGLTGAAFGGPYVGVEALADRVDVAARLLRQPGLAYLYWGGIDKLGHHHGWQSWQWGDALSDLDQELRRLTRLLPRGSHLLITADHGMVDIDPALVWDVARTPALGEGVTALAGEPRCTHLYTTSPDAVVSRWCETLQDQAQVWLQAEVIERGLLGPVSEAARASVGDVVVAARGRAAIVDSRVHSQAAMNLVGMHGSLTAQEMHIPLLIETLG